MKANELMLGNCILKHFEGGEGELEVVTSRTIFDCQVNPTGKFTYSGIPLTPEILEKCGFDYDASYEVPKVQKGNFILWDGFDGSFSANFGGLTRLDVYVKYLHQLQNLYFAITCQELEVKL